MHQRFICQILRRPILEGGGGCGKTTIAKQNSFYVKYTDFSLSAKVEENRPFGSF